MAITINGTGTITGISAGGLPDGTVTAADLASSLDLTGKTVTLPSGTGGKILQVKTTQYETATSIDVTADTWKELPFSVEITPTSASSRFIVTYQTVGELGSNNHWNSSCGLGRANNSGSGYGSISWFEPSSHGNRIPHLGLITISYNSSDNASTPEQLMVTGYVDDPDTTDTLKYYPGVHTDTSTTWYVNRTVTDSDTSSYNRAISWMTVMEVAD